MKIITKKNLAIYYTKRKQINNTFNNSKNPHRLSGARPNYFSTGTLWMMAAPLPRAREKIFILIRVRGMCLFRSLCGWSLVVGLIGRGLGCGKVGLASRKLEWNAGKARECCRDVSRVRCFDLYSQHCGTMFKQCSMLCFEYHHYIFNFQKLSDTNQIFVMITDKKNPNEKVFTKTIINEKMSTNNLVFFFKF